MKTKTVRTFINSVAIVFVSVAIPVLSGCHTVRTDVDANSGEMKERTYFFGMRVSEHVEESVFSREIHRLGIRPPEMRNWKPATPREEYDGAVEDCDFLVDLLRMIGLTDQDRKAILEKALSNLQTGKLDQTFDLITEASDRLRALHGLPPVPEGQRMKWSDRRRSVAH
jgi:hypothetical protein